jgi:glyoxylase-like metal-dependent hydrolase (beta-lactamase superfamily II)
VAAAYSTPEPWSPDGPAEEIAPGFWRLPMPIPFHSMRGVCVYLVRDADSYLLFDAGMDISSCAQRLEHHVGRIGASLDALHTIVLSHGHPDHAGLAESLRARSGARIWLHGQDVRLVAGADQVGEAGLEMIHRWLIRHGFPAHEADSARQSVDDGRGTMKRLDVDRRLEGGETLAVGPYRFEVLWTPGHTPGHVCLFEATHRLLLAGDALFGRATPNVRLMPYSRPDVIRHYLASLDAVRRLAPERGLPAHGEPFGRVAERAAAVQQRQIARRAQLLTLLTDQPRTAYELAQVVWGPEARSSWASFHGRLRRNAALLLAAHLELLALDGEIERREDGTVVFAERS